MPKSIALNPDMEKQFQKIQFELSTKRGVFQNPQKVLNYLFETALWDLGNKGK